MLPTFDPVTGLQATAFEMNLNGLISDRDLSILEALTEGMTTDSDALELTTILTNEDIENEDIADCIIARKFDTALMILW